MPRRVITLILAVNTIGCVSFATIRADAEAVFREHNRVASEVMYTGVELEADDPDAISLVQADTAMLSACQVLNDLAIARRDSQNLRWRQKLKLADTIDACRQATAETAGLLQQIDAR